VRKVGDKVRIRSWLDMLMVDGKLDKYDNIWLGDESFVSNMREFCDRELTIDIVDERRGHYIMEEDSEMWVFTEDMFVQ
jgi:hypothetical protein